MSQMKNGHSFIIRSCGLFLLGRDMESFVCYGKKWLDERVQCENNLSVCDQIAILCLHIYNYI